MDMSTSLDPIGPKVQMAVQRLVLDTTKADGLGLIGMLAATPAGSTNSATQGRFLDARA
jgi:hypothetical protein